jgi:hypothetical protein
MCTEYFLGQDSPENRRVFLTVDCVLGFDIAKYSNFEEEEEIILPPGSVFRVVHRSCEGTRLDIHIRQLPVQQAVSEALGLTGEELFTSAPEQQCRHMELPAGGGSGSGFLFAKDGAVQLGAQTRQDLDLAAAASNSRHVRQQRAVSCEWKQDAPLGQVPYADLEVATASFSESNRLGGGASCFVYKAQLYGTFVACKHLSLVSTPGATDLNPEEGWDCKQFERKWICFVPYHIQIFAVY